MKKFNYELLFNEVKRKGIKQSYVAKVIGMTDSSLSRKLNGKQGIELTGSQVAMICSLIQSPLDMFVMEVGND